MPSELEITTRAVPAIGSSRPVLLCVGSDLALLSYRAEVLTQAGFRVVSVPTETGEAEQFTELCRRHKPVLAIACHTLTQKERLVFAAQLRTAFPDMKLVALTTGAMTPYETPGYDLLLDSLDGPAALIHHVRAQL